MKSIDLRLIIPFGILALPCMAYPATIYVPGDIASVTEAIEAAASGDTIQLTETTVFVGQPLEVKDKNLVIRGPSKENRVLLEFNTGSRPPISFSSEPADQTLLVENADVTLQYIQVDTPSASRLVSTSLVYRTGWPIQVVSGSLVIEDCVLHCSILASAPLRIERSQIVGYSERTNPNPPYPAGDDDRPAVSIVGPMSGEIVLLDSTLTGDHCAGLALRDLSGVVVRAENCQIAGGMPSGPRRVRGVSGSAGMTVSNCQQTRLEMTGSSVIGSEGGWGGCCIPYAYQRGGNGGNGLDVADSTLTLWGGEFRGGLGGEGRIHLESSRPVFYKAGIGGNGLALQNSHVNVGEAVFLPGDGHELLGGYIHDVYTEIPGGVPGEAVVLDESSTLTYDSGVGEWLRYRGAIRE